MPASSVSRPRLTDSQGPIRALAAEGALPGANSAGGIADFSCTFAIPIAGVGFRIRLLKIGTPGAFFLSLMNRFSNGRSYEFRSSAFGRRGDPIEGPVGRWSESFPRVVVVSTIAQTAI